MFLCFLLHRKNRASFCFMRIYTDLYPIICRDFVLDYDYDSDFETIDYDYE